MRRKDDDDVRLPDKIPWNSDRAWWPQRLTLPVLVVFMVAMAVLAVWNAVFG